MFAYHTKPHEATGKSPFYLLYGRDAIIPCDSTLATKRSAYQVDVDVYKSELVWGLSEAWDIARKEIQEAQKKQYHHTEKGMKQCIEM